MKNSFLNIKCKCGCNNFYLHEDTKSGMHIGIYCKDCNARQGGKWVSQKTTIDDPISEVDKLAQCKNIEDLRENKPNNISNVMEVKKEGNIIYFRREA